MDIIPFSNDNYFLETYFFKIKEKSRVIYWIIITAILSLIISLPFIYVDISIQARGFFQSNLEKQTIYSPVSGKIIFSSIKTGSKVRKGDTLLIIDSEAIRANKIATGQRILENNLAMLDLKVLITIEPERINLPEISLNTPRYISEYDDVRRQYLIQSQKVKKAEDDFKRNDYLYNQALIPLVEYEASRYLYNSEKENLRRVLSSRIISWQYDLNQRKIDSIRLMAEYCHYAEELDNRIITSPVSGEIIFSSDFQEMSMISINQKIIELSPEGELLANILIKPSDIGFIHEGQAVKIQVDAFNYNEWGMLNGEIIDISDDIIMGENSYAFFRVRCRLLNNTLTLKNGYKATMKKGMSINTRILITRRSLFNLLFDRIHKWLNPYQNKKTNYPYETHMFFQTQTGMKIILKTYPQPTCRGLNHECSLKSPVRGFRGQYKKEGFFDNSTG